ncbi:Alpha/beta hydrolase family-domain-containing protein [Mycena albidolilacea]|uniref:Alpha/beta hydrolase family-domain-containing protein n=1 Tax=Mycena albidolilacea TaxID=1033008 RepID=A0AAD6Z741_9AGAR|nr:Alpha/beta hydrolase family-domain-containing protein [Mycena albidolilacea]
MLLCALSILFSLSRVYVASGASCDCSSLVIPVDVDVLIPKDPTDIFGGLKSNASSLRRLQATYDVYGVFCQPATVPPVNADVVQFLVHGFTYTNQYWSPPIEEFRNYSYSAFSCDRGLPSLAIDWVGVGLSSRPVNASDVQYATEAAVASQLARQLKNVSIFPGVQPFKKVIGIGHSAGSVLLNFAALVEGPRSPFDGLIMTGALIVEPNTLPPLPILSARDDDPLRWGGLDPDYLTTSSRNIFYGRDPATFSPRMLRFDNFTKDVGSIASLLQVPISTLPTQYTGPIAKVVGSEDQLLCPGTRCEDVAALNAMEKVLWPDAKSFEVVVAQGSGHDLNLDFLAEGPFNTFVRLVEQFST